MMPPGPRHTGDDAPARAVRVKICGLTTVDDALAVSSAGADWIGLNFYPKSARFVHEDIAREIATALPAQTQPVGVFVDRPPDEVLAVAKRVGLRIVQLGGDEPPEDLVALRSVQVVRGFRLGDRASIERMQAYLEQAARLGRVPDAVLIDAYVPGQAGGTGHEVALDVLDALPAGLPHLILAGGLTPENVAERVARVRPWMVDVASGVESSPGRKAAERVAAFIRAAKGASDKPGT